MGIGSSKLGTMSDDEVDHLKSSWKLVAQNGEENGILIFKTFLEKHNYYKFFRKLAGVSPAELSENKLFQRHSSAIISTINNVISHIGNATLLKADLVELGKLHKTKNVTPVQFQEIKAVILDILEAKFKFPVETLHAWNKAFEIAYGYVFEALVPKEGTSRSGK